MADKELELVRPRLVVALGATAVLALAGTAIPIMRSRGPADFNGLRGFITVHPSYLLRLRGDRRAQERFPTVREGPAIRPRAGFQVRPVSEEDAAAIPVDFVRSSCWRVP